MAPELQRAIDDAYRVFARYDLGGGIEVCRCPVCVAPEFERALNTTPLRDMSRELLAEYTASAHGWGSDKTANDLRYLLPRYFELIAQLQYPSFLDEDGCLSRLHLDHYRSAWPADEVAAIDRFFLALFRQALLAPIDIRERGGRIVGEPGVATILSLIACAGGDFSPLLDAWANERAREANLRLADFAVGLSQGVMEQWWSANRRQDASGEHLAEPAARGLAEKYALDDGRLGIDREMQRAVRWVARTETRERLERAFLAEQNPKAATMLSLAEQVVTALIVRQP